MTEQYSPDPEAAALAAQVLDAGIAIRAGQALAQQKLEEEARIRLEREGSYEVQLATETEQLLGRMAWVHRHPRISRIFGGSRVGVHSVQDKDDRFFDYRRIATDPLTDGAIAQLSGEHLLFSGLIFTSARRYRGYQDERELWISQQVKDHSTGAEGSIRLYSIWPYDTKKGPRVALSGEQQDVKKWDSEHRRKKMEKYLAKNPHLVEYGFKDGIDCDSSSPNFPRKPRNGLKGFEGTMQRLSFSIHADELRNVLWPPKGFRYPDEMYLGPLTLVRQMNMLLGTKTDKK